MRLDFPQVLADLGEGLVDAEEQDHLLAGDAHDHRPDDDGQQSADGAGRVAVTPQVRKQHHQTSNHHKASPDPENESNNGWGDHLTEREKFLHGCSSFHGNQSVHHYGTALGINRLKMGGMYKKPPSPAVQSEILRLLVEVPNLKPSRLSPKSYLNKFPSTRNNIKFIFDLNRFLFVCLFL